MSIPADQPLTAQELKRELQLADMCIVTLREEITRMKQYPKLSEEELDRIAEKLVEKFLSVEISISSEDGGAAVTTAMENEA